MTKLSSIFARVIISLLSLALVVTIVAPASRAFAATSSSTNTQPKVQEVPKAVDDYVKTYGEPKNQSDAEKYLNYLGNSKEYKLYESSRLSSTGGYQTMGLIGGGLKAIKIFGWACRIGGKTLKYAIRPLSKSKAKIIDHNARKIARACEIVNNFSKKALVAALHKAGVKGKLADTIAEIILWLI